MEPQRASLLGAPSPEALESTDARIAHELAETSAAVHSATAAWRQLASRLALARESRASASASTREHARLAASAERGAERAEAQLRHDHETRRLLAAADARAAELSERLAAATATARALEAEKAALVARLAVYERAGNGRLRDGLATWEPRGPPGASGPTLQLESADVTDDERRRAGERSAATAASATRGSVLGSATDRGPATPLSSRVSETMRAAAEYRAYLAGRT